MKPVCPTSSARLLLRHQRFIFLSKTTSAFNSSKPENDESSPLCNNRGVATAEESPVLLHFDEEHFQIPICWDSTVNNQKLLLCFVCNSQTLRGVIFFISLQKKKICNRMMLNI